MRVVFIGFNILSLEELKCAFLGLVSRLHEILERLLALRVLSAADDAALVLHQVLLLKTTGCVVRCTVPYLGLAADSRGLGRAASGPTAATRATRNITPRVGISVGVVIRVTVRVHFFCW